MLVKPYVFHFIFVEAGFLNVTTILEKNKLITENNVPSLDGCIRHSG